MTDDTSSDDSLAAELKSFDAILLHDVIDGLRRAKQDQSQGVKRDLIRAMFAAIDGSAWGYRQHISSIAKSIDELTPTMDMALSESTYAVSHSGKLKLQTRPIPLDAMIRFTTRVASEISNDVQVDFGGQSWDEFQQAIVIRNRITHPKSRTDLEITDQDVAVVTRSLFWLLELIQKVMVATNHRAATYLKQSRNFLARLVNGDQVASAEYQRALETLDDND